MKNKILNIILAAGLLLSLSSCDKFFEGINDSPNQPEAVPPQLLLPSTQAFLAYGMQGDVSRFTAMLTQQVTGATRQFATYQKYNITETEFDNLWRFNLYAGPLMDLNVLQNQSTENDWPYYEGVSKTLMAYGLMQTTDLFGSVPYTEAFQGFENLKPVYDTQESIYNSIFTLLSEARTALAVADGGLVAPGDDDLIYGGDVAMWTTFTNFLEARAHLHLGKVAASHYDDALAAIDAGAFASEADDAVYMFGTNQTASAPWFQYIQQRDDIVYEGWIYDYMEGEGDPRHTVYLDTATMSLGDAFARPDAPFYFGSYVEQKFIEAEAAFESSDPGRAATAHNEAVMASLAQFGVSDLAFEALHASHTSGTITLEEIMNQKYVALFLQTEVFTDWRRTGFPDISPVPDAVLSGIPVRFPYPLSERSYNAGNMPVVTLLTPVWWDK